MCGLAGIVSAGGDGTEALDRMLPAIAHRGPDDEGRYLGESVALGHRRLSIIDLGSGRQPLHDASRTLWLIANAEIYNYVELRKDLEALDQYLALRLIASPRSMFKRVHKLPPGHALTIRPGERARIWRHWTLHYQPKLAGSEDALTDALEAEMLAALRLHLVSDVRVGAFLSGGLDSSLIVAMLARHCVPRGFPTFTISIPHPSFDEAPYARQVAEQYGTEHHEGKLVRNLAESLPTLVW
jgi:asparagine synthetase B (glutamine-hydrolysing)